jgi:hypothetical protein
MCDNKKKGNLTELKTMLAFLELDHNISVPYSESSRYDFVADINGKLIRVQCKTSRIAGRNSFKFKCRSDYCNTTSFSSRPYTKEEIDYFATVWNNVCYLVPVEEAGKSEFSLNLLSAQRPMHYAKDYEIKNVLSKFQ